MASIIQVEPTRLTTTASIMAQNSGLFRCPAPTSSLSFIPLAAEASTKVLKLTAQEKLSPRKTRPAGPMAEEPTPEIRNEMGVRGARTAAKPASATTRVSAIKRTKTAKRNTGISQAARPPLYSQIPMNPKPAIKPSTAVRYDSNSWESSTVEFRPKALLNTSFRCLRAPHRLASTRTIKAPIP